MRSGRERLLLLLHSLAALAGFFTGALTGASIIENTKKGWSYYITLSVTIETIIIFVLVLIWFEEPEVLSNLVLYASILLAAIAMGIQSATIRYLNIPGVVTTFITGTITTLGMSVINGIRRGFRKEIKGDFPVLPIFKTLEKRIELQAIVFFAYGSTAVLTGWLEYHGSLLLPLLPLILIIIVLIIVIRRPEHPHILNNLFEKNSKTIND